MAQGNCPNCNNHYGCACSGGSERRTASDGKQVCSKCITTYELSLVALNKSKNGKNK